MSEARPSVAPRRPADFASSGGKPLERGVKIARVQDQEGLAAGLAAYTEKFVAIDAQQPQPHRDRYDLSGRLPARVPFAASLEFQDDAFRLMADRAPR